jgi:hypothetical protein
MKRWVMSCLLGCLSLPIYFGGRRLKYLLGIRPIDEYMRGSYDFEGYPMLRWIRLHVPAGAKILYLGPIPEGPQFYYQEYELIPMTYYPPHFYSYTEKHMLSQWRYEGIEYIILVKKDMPLNPDSSHTNSYLPSLHLTVPHIPFPVMYETDRAILYQVPGVAAGGGGMVGLTGAKVPPPKE